MALCRIGWHNWTKWEMRKAQASDYDIITGMPYTLTVTMQVRRCEDCGLFHDRRI